MRINIFISLLFVLFSFFNLNAQTYNYSYTDPCTGNVKNIIVPINGSVTVGYYGFVENFTQQQFIDGTFETWANQVFSQYQGSPCAEIVGLGGQINMAQDVALNTIGIINSLSSLMDISNGATDFLSGSLTAASNSSNTNGKKVIRRMGIVPKVEVEIIITVQRQIPITPQPITIKTKIMEQVTLLKEVKPLLEQMKQVQTTEEMEPLIKMVELKIQHQQEELQLRVDQMRMEIHRLTSL